jgi:hypothetical protein
VAKRADPLSKLREIIFKLPETSEKLSHGAPTWWGGKKTFATFHMNHHGDDRVALWCKLPRGAQETLVDAQPELFFVPPYVGPSGWVGINLDAKVDWGMIAALLEDGYRTVAPKRALKLLDDE